MSEGSETKRGKVICIITDEELQRLMALTLMAQRSPVIVTKTVPTAAGGQQQEAQFDCSGRAWQKVRDVWEEMG